jgi:peptidoglycan/xylan/chitin deacetylase (PgdA/CDA1 family)
MNYSNRLHPKSFLPKIILGRALHAFGDNPYGNGELLVLNYHSTPGWLSEEFEKQVQYLSGHFNLVSPNYISEFFENKTVDTSRPSVVFTFDDGIKNNTHAAEILEKYNARGLFFLVPAFLDAPVALQEQYYRQHIRKQVNGNIDTTSTDVTAMDTSEIQELLRRGHAIGSHSYTHTMSSQDDASKNVVEIVKSREFLQSRFNVPVENFCAPFDSLFSTGKKQMDLIREHYRYFHSTFPGSNSVIPDPFFIRRVNLECWWPLDVVRFALSGFEWKRWQVKRNRFRKEVFEY